MPHLFEVADRLGNRLIHLNQNRIDFLAFGRRKYDSWDIVGIFYVIHVAVKQDDSVSLLIVGMILEQFVCILCIELIQ